MSHVASELLIFLLLQRIVAVGRRDGYQHLCPRCLMHWPNVRLFTDARVGCQQQHTCANHERTVRRDRRNPACRTKRHAHGTDASSRLSPASSLPPLGLVKSPRSWFCPFSRKTKRPPSSSLKLNCPA